jgi:GTP1/Obg family GTP-binding protein
MQGDIKAGQRDIYQEVKASLPTSEIKVVFNKVDMNFQPDEEEDEADYFERQKENSAEQLGCPKDNIYYACFKPSCSNERMRELKELGVLGFEDFFQELRILEG